VCARAKTREWAQEIARTADIAKREN